MLEPLPLFFVAIGALLIIWLTWGRENSADWRHEGRCTNCGYDLRYSKERCPECATAIGIRSGDFFPLRDDWPATPINPRRPEAGETPITVHQTNIFGQAMLMRDQLNVRGVACWIEKHQPTQLVQYQTAGPEEISVMVWSADESLARELLDHLTKPRPKAE
jgi:hypothetical protein